MHVEPTNPCLGGLTPVAKPLIPDTPQPLTHLLGDTPSKDGRARDTDTSTAYKVLHAHQDTAYVMHEGPRHQKNDNLPNTEPQPIVESIIYVPHTVTCARHYRLQTTSSPRSIDNYSYD